MENFYFISIFKIFFKIIFTCSKGEDPMEKDTIFYLYVTWNASIFVSFYCILYHRDV